MKLHRQNSYRELTQKLFSDCKNCCGLCCVALYFAKSEGFPEDKLPGNPCMHLERDFRCRIHGSLASEGLKGCVAFDCFGAGSQVTQVNCKGKNWRKNPDFAKDMYAAYLGMNQYHQMLWYLVEASMLTEDLRLLGEIDLLIGENEKTTALPVKDFLTENRSDHRQKVNRVLKQVCAAVAASFEGLEAEKNVDLMGHDLREEDLLGRDFSMTLMVASVLRGCDLFGANFLGADLRDADLRDADLSESIFLTQIQINAAQGNGNTKLPPMIRRPITWEY